MADFSKEIIQCLTAMQSAFDKGYEKGKADAIAELQPFFDEIENSGLDFFCDDLCGEFVD